jgi:LysM repeat protein
MTYPSSEELVRRAVRDHQRIGRLGGGCWVVPAQAPSRKPSCKPSPKDPLRETLRTSYGTWLRTTAVTGLASALLVPSGAAASAAVGPGIPATDPQAARFPRIEVDRLAPRPQAFLGGLTHSPARDHPPQAVVQRGQQVGKSIAPLQIPPPARQPRVVQVPARRIRSVTAPNPQVSPGASALKERAKVAKSPSTKPKRVDQGLTRARTAVRKSSKPRALQDAAGRPSLVAVDKVSPTPRMGWSYRVQRGDSLWHISMQLWEDRFPDGPSLERTSHVLHEWNRSVVGPNRNRIYPGQVLEIPSDARSITTTWSGGFAHPVAKDIAR